MDLCNGCDDTRNSLWLLRLTPDKVRLAQFLQEHGVILGPRVVCPSCDKECHFYEDQWSFRCTGMQPLNSKKGKAARKPCGYFVSARKESTPLGGPGKVVEIDEAKSDKRKRSEGKILDGEGIFGGFERGSRNVFLVPVPDRSKETLLGFIKQWVLPGTTVVSNCWKAYGTVGNEGYTQLTVNHSLNFVDPVTGANTQYIERTWREVQGGVPRYGQRSHCMVGYLAEFLFKRKFVTDQERIHKFLLGAAHLYPPGSENEVMGDGADSEDSGDLSEVD